MGASSGGRLATYRRKRDFGGTPEPRGRARRVTPGARGRFVVQKHDATALHYDVRLEIGGVLVSWAVPKGPSLNPRDKRLAMPTEDHPLDYIDFEGVIPAGHYGAGPVIVWDTGTYTNVTQRDGKPVDAARAVRNGHIVVQLEGHKLRGGYAFTRVGGSGARPRWLLVKLKDEHADSRIDVTTSRPESVLTGRRIEDVRARRRRRSA
jgi:DNA ligase D-like protein (predicted 3'-phosphoesterase)